MSINLELAESRDLSEETVVAIEEIHKRLDWILTRPSMHVESPKKVVEVVRSFEYTLQMLWGFPLDPNYHTYWYELKYCTCPVLDNRENFGLPYKVTNEHCPYHSITRVAETWEDRRFT